MTARVGVLIALAWWMGSGCGSRDLPRSITFQAVNRTVVLHIAKEESERLPQAAAASVNILSDMALRFDRKNPDSEINRINTMAHVTELPISMDMYQVLFHARRFYELTGGVFDVSIGPMLYAWGFNGGVVPTRMTAEAIQAAQYSYGLPKILIREFSVEFPSSLNQLDLEGLMDGYLADRCVQSLRANEFNNLLLQVDSSYRCLGAGAQGNGWEVPVRHPLAGSNQWMRVRIPPNQALSSSHAFSEHRESGRQMISHIIDPRSGIPVTGTLMSVVIHPVATTSDALATSLLVVGVEEAPALLGKFPKAEALVVPNTRPLQIFATEGMRNQLVLPKGFESAIQPLLIDVPEVEPAPVPGPPSEIPPASPDGTTLLENLGGDDDSGAATSPPTATPAAP